MYALFNEEGKLVGSYEYTNFEGPIEPGSILLTDEQVANIGYLRLVDGEVVIDTHQKEIDDLKREKEVTIAEVKGQMADIEKQYIQNQLLGEYAIQTMAGKTLQEQYIELYQQLLELED